MSGTRIEDMVYGVKQNGFKTDEDITATGSLTVSGVVNANTAGIRTIQSTADVTQAAPTDAELNAAFGTPESLGRGFIATIDDNDGDSAGILVWTSDASWYHVIGTKST